MNSIKAQDLKNKFLIYDMVKKYFNFNKKSLRLFKYRLFYEPHFNDMYKSLGEFDETGRLRLSVDGKNGEFIDKGWKYIKENFNNTIIDLGITYADFIDNKVTVNKQRVKLQKAIINHILKKTLTSEYNYVSKGTSSGRIENYVRRHFEKAATLVISKKIKEVVISLNFADWFLCSTKENWTSCLSLESDYEIGHWSGLPGLIGDKNRAMIYTTNGDNKNYKGIITDKFIVRSWMLTCRSKDDQVIRDNYYSGNYEYGSKPEVKVIKNEPFLKIVNEYPTEIGISDMLNKLLPESKHKIFGTRSDVSFKSRYYGENLFHNIQGREITSGIYQDRYYAALAKKNKGQMFPGEYYYLKSGGCGTSFFTKEGRSDSGYDFYFGDSEGLTTIIDEHKTLESFLEDNRDDYTTCYNCGDHCDEDDMIQSSTDGEYYCDYCYNEKFYSCDKCGETVEKEDTIYIYDINEYVCTNCSDKYYYECEECHKHFSEVNIDDDGDYLCEDCKKKIVIEEDDKKLA